MSKDINDDRYKFSVFIPTSSELNFVSRNKKRSKPLDVDAFMARAVTGKIPIEVINLKDGGLASLPVSVYGKTTVVTFGILEAAGLDQFGNLQIRMRISSAAEVIFNSEKVGAAGKNKGAHGKKIIYVVN